MSVQVFERASASFAAGLAKRGHHIVYRANSQNHCPGCGRSQWYIGRVSAECSFCATAVPLAEAQWQEASPRALATASRNVALSSDQRRFERTPANGRKLQLLIDGSPTSFALHNISEGGVMGDSVPDLVPGAKVHVRFEGGVLVPAVVKWSEDGLVGLAFIDPIMLDHPDKAAN
ncbi:MAG: PilZ domain-containing protein [Sphingomicrobium sp.]